MEALTSSLPITAPSSLSGPITSAPTTAAAPDYTSAYSSLLNSVNTAQMQDQMLQQWEGVTTSLFPTSPSPYPTPAPAPPPQNLVQKGTNDSGLIQGQQDWVMQGNDNESAHVVGDDNRVTQGNPLGFPTWWGYQPPPGNNNTAFVHGDNNYVNQTKNNGNAFVQGSHDSVYQGGDSDTTRLIGDSDRVASYGTNDNVSIDGSNVGVFVQGDNVSASFKDGKWSVKGGTATLHQDQSGSWWTITSNSYTPPPMLPDPIGTVPTISPLGPFAPPPPTLPTTLPPSLNLNPAAPPAPTGVTSTTSSGGTTSTPVTTFTLPTSV